MPRIMNDGEAVELWAIDKAHELTTADICCKCALFEVKDGHKTFADFPKLQELLSSDPAEPVGECITFINHDQHEDYEGREIKCVLCSRELTSHDN